MHDQNVPNPLAKNPNFFTHKVFAAIGLILIGAIIAISGIWYYIKNQDRSSGVGDDTTTTKISTSSANVKKYKISEIFGQRGNISSKQLNTSTWKEYKSQYFSIKYPTDFTSNNAKNGLSLQSSDYKFNQPAQQVSGTSISVGYDSATLQSFYTFDKVVEGKKSDSGYSVKDYILLDNQNAV